MEILAVVVFEAAVLARGCGDVRGWSSDAGICMDRLRRSLDVEWMVSD